MRRSSRGPTKYKKDLKPLCSDGAKEYLAAQKSSKAFLSAIFDYARSNPDCLYGKYAIISYDKCARA